eukprot:3409440-Rhodomonas_salina.1
MCGTESAHAVQSAQYYWQARLVLTAAVVVPGLERGAAAVQEHAASSARGRRDCRGAPPLRARITCPSARIARAFL